MGNRITLMRPIWAGLKRFSRQSRATALDRGTARSLCEIADAGADQFSAALIVAGAGARQIGNSK